MLCTWGYRFMSAKGDMGLEKLFTEARGIRMKNSMINQEQGMPVDLFMRFYRLRVKIKRLTAALIVLCLVFATCLTALLVQMAGVPEERILAAPADESGQLAQERLDQANARYDALKGEYDQLMAEKARLGDSEAQSREELAFYQENIAFLVTTDMFYHTRHCPEVSKSEDLWAYTVAQCVYLGYEKCPKCHDQD